MSISNHEETGNRILTFIFFCLFALSGAAGLIYEVVWVRQFTHILGASTYAVTTILGTFMAGLGLGSWLLGRRADSLSLSALSRTYIALETGIGVYTLLLPKFLDVAETAYVTFYRLSDPNTLLFNGLKLVLAFLLLIIPTTLIGGTLPVLSRYIIRSRHTISASISKLYAVNTFGAILGTICTGYILLPRLGIQATTMVAVCANFAVAGIFWVTTRSAPSSLSFIQTSRTPGDAKAKTTWAQKAVLAGFFLSGISAMFYEVAWTRTLSMILGTTTFAFTTMLATFLTGIALGSALYGVIRKIVSGVNLFLALQAVVMISVLFTIPLFEKLPLIFILLEDVWIDSWLDMQFLRFFMAAAIMLVPTLAMGALLPVVSQIFIKKTNHLGKRLGKAFGLNTLGNVIGAIVAGLFLVPAIGMQKTIMLGAGLNLIGSLCVILSQHRVSLARRQLAIATACVSFFLVNWMIEPWAPRVMNSGVYVYASRYENMLDRYEKASSKQNALPDMAHWDVLEFAMKQYDLLYYDTGITATVAVMQESDGTRFLTVDGKTDASTGGKSDMKTQVMIGQLPLLYHKDPDKVLVVGLGSGVTAGSVLTHDVRVVDCAEISPSVVKASQLFSDFNHNALDDQRLKVIARDARNMLLTSEVRYDAIISQPSNPWIRGESDLFSLEWYKIVKAHLQRDGLFVQWAPSYLTSGRSLKVIVHTLRSVFPHLTVWTSGSVGDLIFVAKKGGPLHIDYKSFLKRVEKSTVRSDIERLGLVPAILPFELFVMNEKELSEYLYADLEKPLQRNTDNLLITEFSMPKQLTQRNKPNGFIDPERLHGDIDSLLPMLKNVDYGWLKRRLHRELGPKQQHTNTT